MSMSSRITVWIACCLCLGGAGQAKDSMVITSPAFQPSAEIPVQHTCQGKDSSPALSWTGVPAGAKSLALVVEDPDAPDPAKPLRVWDHWVVYNLPAQTAGLAEGLSPDKLPKGALSGKTSAGEQRYHGPCPPIGRHRYFFKLYALDLTLPDLKGPEKKKLLEAMAGHILAQAEIVGTYQKKDRTAQEGTLPRDAIEEVVHRHLGKLQPCYDELLKKSPKGQKKNGLIVYHWTVRPDGTTGDVKLARADGDLAALEPCYTAEIKSWKFPKPKGGPVPVEYPFNFSSAGF